MTTVLLIRHGMTDAVGHKLVGWTPGVGLNALGKEQASRLGAQLAGVPLQAIYSSPLDRARATAEAIAGKHGLPVQFRDGLGEVRFGDWTGMLISEIQNDPRWQEWNQFRATARTPNGESFLELQDRMISELNAIAAAHPASVVAVVSHADAVRAALLQLLGMPGDFCLRLDIKPASVSVVQLSPDQAPRVISMNIAVDGLKAIQDESPR